MLDFPDKVLVNHRYSKILFLEVPKGGNSYLGGQCFSIFEIDAAGGAWNFVGDLVDLRLCKCI